MTFHQKAENDPRCCHPMEFSSGYVPKNQGGLYTAVFSVLFDHTASGLILSKEKESVDLEAVIKLA